MILGPGFIVCLSCSFIQPGQTSQVNHFSKQWNPTSQCKTGSSLVQSSQICQTETPKAQLHPDWLGFCQSLLCNILKTSEVTYSQTTFAKAIAVITCACESIFNCSLLNAFPAALVGSESQAASYDASDVLSRPCFQRTHSLRLARSTCTLATRNVPLQDC